MAIPDLPTSWLVPDWPAPANVRAVVTTREGPGDASHSPWGFNVGTRCGDDAAAVAAHRAGLAGLLALPGPPCWLRQVHGTRVLDIDEEASAEPEADAAVTRKPGVVLAIQTADCLPVLFCADDGTEVAAAHAGWRGLSSGVLEATLDAMRAPAARVMAWLGPAIAAASYEIGDEVREAFLVPDPGAAPAFAATRPGHWTCDLYELARRRLADAGVTRVFGGGRDTFTDPHLHSFRRDGAHSGRMASLLWKNRGQSRIS